jgi:hypothetical protein
MPRQGWLQRYFFVYWLVFAGFFLVTSAFRVYSFLHERNDIWWTPLAMLVPLGASQDRVAVYVRGNELQDLLGAGRLRLVTDSAPRVLSAADIGFRFNNWDRVRAERVPLILTYAAAAGAAAAFLVVGFVYLVRRRRGISP